MLEVGWPEPAAVVERMLSARSCVARSFHCCGICTIVGLSPLLRDGSKGRRIVSCAGFSSVGYPVRQQTGSALTVIRTLSGWTVGARGSGRAFDISRLDFLWSTQFYRGGSS